MLVEDSILINLNSQSAISSNGEYLSNVLFKTCGILKPDSTIVYSQISLLNAQIPSSFSVINDSNNTLNYTVNGTNKSINITQGNYNFYSLQQTIQTLLLNNGDTFSITLNQISSQITFTSSNTFSILSTSSCKSILGFLDTLNSVGGVITLPQPMNLLGITKMKIVSKLLPTSNYDIYQNCVLNVVPVATIGGGLIAWENISQHKNILKTNRIDNIDIQIFDQNGEYVNFHHQHWTLTIQLSIFRNFVYNSTTLNDHRTQE